MTAGLYKGVAESGLLRHTERVRRHRTTWGGWTIAAITAVGVCSPARGQLWNEFVQGDLSDNRFAPTPLSLVPGSNQLIGSMAGDLGGGNVDRDYFSITVPPGHVLSQIVCEQYFSLDPVAFLGIQPGPTFPNDPNTVEPGDLLGWIHLSIDHVGVDILPVMGFEGQGFVPPLPAGVYSFWAQQLGEPTDYVLDFVVQVPAPSSAIVAGLVGMALVRRRRAGSIR